MSPKEKEQKIKDLEARGYFYDKTLDCMYRPVIFAMLISFDGVPELAQNGKPKYVKLHPALQQKITTLHDDKVTKAAEDKARERCKDCRRCHIGLAGLCCDRIRAMVSVDSEDADPEPDLELDDPEPER